MKPGTDHRWLLAALVGFIAVTVGYVVIPRLRERPFEPPPPREPVRSDRFHLEGVDYTYSEEGTRLFRFRADELVHRKRKVGPLTINPVKEIGMKGVHLSIYAPGDDVEGDGADDGAGADEARGVSGASERFLTLPLAQILEKTAPLRSLGFVSRVMVDGVTIEFLSGDRVDFTLTADRFKGGVRDSAVTFSGSVALVASDGHELNAERLSWRRSGGRIRAEGGYVLRGADGQESRGDAGSFYLKSGGVLRQISVR